MTGDSESARPAIIAAFNRLVLAHRKPRPNVEEILAEAGVARSTFYAHFDSRDSLRLTALSAPLSIVADALTGKGGSERFVAILDHFRENRRSAVEFLTGKLGPRIVRMLADLVAERLDEGESRKVALHLADGAVGFLRLWLTGETPYSPQDLARMMIASAAAQRAALASALGE